MNKENYPPLSQWREAEAKFKKLPLKNGEFMLLINPQNGQALNLIARDKGEMKQTPHIDGIGFSSLTNVGMRKVSALELEKREKK